MNKYFFKMMGYLDMDGDFFNEILKSAGFGEQATEQKTPTSEEGEQVTIVKNFREENGSYVGKIITEEFTSADGSEIKTKKTRVLVNMCIGPHAVSNNTKDPSYPYFAGYCSECSRPSCNLHLHKCDEPGCDKMVCPTCSAEYSPGKYKCISHYRLHKVKQICKFVVSPFYQFSEPPKDQVLTPCNTSKKKSECEN